MRACRHLLGATNGRTQATTTGSGWSPQRVQSGQTSVSPNGPAVEGLTPQVGDRVPGERVLLDADRPLLAVTPQTGGP